MEAGAGAETETVTVWVFMWGRTETRCAQGRMVMMWLNGEVKGAGQTQ